MAVLHESKLKQREFKSFQRLVHELAGIALSDSKETMVQSRLLKRLRALNLDSFEAYWELLASGKASDEVTNFVNALTTNKTDFFRENHHFGYLTSTVFPQIKERATNGGRKTLRIWCSASSTGEEPYSIAMVIREFFGTDASWDIRILASDIDTNVLETAKAGVYSSDRIADVPDELLRRYFERQSRASGNVVRAKPVLRDLITFRQINLTHRDWPINALFDVIFCRNVMIYFNAETQSSVVNHFAEKLQPEGYLIIGHSESLNGLSDKFKPLGQTIYLHRPSSSASPHSATRTLVHPPLDLSLRKAVGPLESRPVKNAAISSLAKNENTRSLIVGEVHASREPIWITTTLGSCIATCLYDEVAKVGGMNHFRLPESKTPSENCPSFGVHAMEMLINAIMQQGGDRRRLKAKVFGGGAVIEPGDERWNIGQRNIEFTERFLSTESIPIVARHTGGFVGMQVHFHTQTAKVLIKPLDKMTSVSVEKEERRSAARAASTQAQAVDVTLF